MSDGINVVPIRTCICGEAGTPRDVVWQSNGETLMIEIVACDACWAKTNNTLARVRPVFDAMIACGVPRDTANETMTFMLERMDA